MPFNAALTAGQITQVRKDVQSFEHYMLVTPNDIVWQAQVNSTKSNVVYRNFNWTTTLQGAYTSVIAGQLVLITSSTTDFTAPVFRGRASIAPTDTVVYVNESGKNIDTSMYVTVFDTFEVGERLAALVSGSVFIDGVQSFQKLPPTISGLQSAYVDFSESDPVTLSFAPTATAQSSGASISSWLWDVGDGSITVGSTTTQNITVEFPGYGTNEHRWVHLTVTDNNGVSQAFHFQVFTVAKNSSSVVALNTGQLSISGSIQDGWNGDVVVWGASFAKDDVLDLTRVVVAGIDNYDGTSTPIVSNIMLIGQMRTETNTPTASEDNVTTETSISIEGFGSQLARIPFVAQQILDDDTPTAYGEIINPTPERVITYILAYNTTILSLCSIDFEDLSGYGMGDTNLSDANALQNSLDIADVVKATLVYAPAGEIAVYRNANYISSSDRNALATILDLTEADYHDFNLDIRYGESIGQAVAGAIVYDTTNNQIDQLWTARAPAESFGSGYEETRMGNQVLTADSTQANARTELSQRIGNDLAFVNPKPILSATMKAGFWWMIPTLHQWWTHTITAGTTVRERTYTTADRWWLSSVTYSADNELNTRETNATWELETESTNAGIVPNLVPDVNEPTFDFPPLGGFDFFVDDPLVNYSTDTPTDLLPLEGDYGLEPYPPANDNTPIVGQEKLDVLFGVSKNVSTTRTSTLGETYVVEVYGDAQISTSGWSKTFDFTASNGGWTGGRPDGNAAVTASYVAATGWRHTGDTSQTDFGMYIACAASTEITSVAITHTLSATSPLPGWVWLDSSVASNAELFRANGRNVTGTNSYSDSVNYTIANGNICFQTTLSTSSVSSGVVCTVTSITITGNGSCPFAGCSSGAGEGRGDAFYYDYNVGNTTAYSAGSGLLVDGANPTAPPYSDSHSYQFEVTGTGSALVFTYADSDYSDNDNNILKVIVTGPNMGVSA